MRDEDSDEKPVQDYLALRRGLGFKLKKHPRFLEEFASFLEQESVVADHFSACLAMGDATTAHTAGGVGRPAKRRARVRALLERNGPDDGDSA